MNASENDDENMTQHRSEYVNQLLEKNRQVGVTSKVISGSQKYCLNKRGLM